MERGRLGEFVRRRRRAHFEMSSTNRTRRFVVRLPLSTDCRTKSGLGGVAGYPRGTGGGRNFRWARTRSCWALPAAGVSLAVSPLRIPPNLPFATSSNLSFMSWSAVAQLRSDGYRVPSGSNPRFCSMFCRYQGWPCRSFTERSRAAMQRPGVMSLLTRPSSLS